MESRLRGTLSNQKYEIIWGSLIGMADRLKF